jgi:hypothetical protein
VKRNRAERYHAARDALTRALREVRAFQGGSSGPLSDPVLDAFLKLDAEYCGGDPTGANADRIFKERQQWKKQKERSRLAVLRN